eukprot:TRINITY_DN11424_c0_g2_i1.p4 TRINITY_DN11424_c0_g2~~TRINITY_DN11424_c0_g2_i1.p4  ORF type:complete len:114 (-),score=36.13 TRINITY_DN11424_c0_g2_i1:57-398(-)
MRVPNSVDMVRAEFPLNASRLDSAFATFNSDDLGLLRMWNGPNIFLGPSPTSQRELGRFVSHSEDRDESPLDERANCFEGRTGKAAFTGLVAKPYFSSIGMSSEREQEAKHNY